MDKKVKIFIFTAFIIVSGFLIYETANGTLVNYAFEPNQLQPHSLCINTQHHRKWWFPWRSLQYIW